jgi:hypothetical protein
LDTTVNLAVPFRGCKHLNRNNPLIAGTNPAPPAPPDSTYSASDLVGVYRGILDALYPPGGRIRHAILLEPSPVRSCPYCIEGEVPRLIRQGIIDPSTEVNFADKPDTTPLRPFSYRIKVDTLTMWDRYWLAESGTVEWEAMKDAYPGVNDAISFLRVGFNDRRTEALAEIYADSAGEESKMSNRPLPGGAYRRAAETILLRKQGADWRVSLRHVERAATSAEWSGGKCEPTPAPAYPPIRADVQTIAGDYRIVRVGAARVFRGRTDTVRIMLGPLRPSAHKPAESVGSAEVLDANGKPDEKIAVGFKLTGDVATLDFGPRLPAGIVQLDGWYEQYRILRTSANGFFGTWYTENGPTVPLQGYFCAARLDSRAR